MQHSKRRCHQGEVHVIAQGRKGVFQFVIADVQDAAAETQTPEQLETLARELAEYDIVIATEVGGGVVPMDAEERAGREAAGRLACLLAERADCVVQMFCGIPTVLKGELPQC